MTTITKRKSAQATKRTAGATPSSSQTTPAATPESSDAEREVDALVARGLVALEKFERLDQEHIDRIVAKASIAALNQHLVLAKLAVEETGRGLVEDKATKNIFACEH
ncbi:MAG: hypothetical protein SOI65_04990, partial [Bifidobacterium crudilactis]